MVHHRRRGGRRAERRQREGRVRHQPEQHILASLQRLPNGFIIDELAIVQELVRRGKLQHHLIHWQRRLLMLPHHLAIMAVR